MIMRPHKGYGIDRSKNATEMSTAMTCGYWLHTWSHYIMKPGLHYETRFTLILTTL